MFHLLGGKLCSCFPRLFRKACANLLSYRSGAVDEFFQTKDLRKQATDQGKAASEPEE
jgi:hypothetical protein